MKDRHFTACTFTGLIGATFLFMGLWPAMGFLPPLSPLATADEIAAYYIAHSTGILTGSILLMLGQSILVPFYAAISTMMRRVDPQSATLSYTQMLTGVYGIVPGFMAAILFSAAAYRPERSPELILLLSDIGFLCLTIASLPGCVQFIAIGLSILADRRPQPLLPRWLGYVHFWIAILFIPGCLVALFKTGPFTWRGALGFWLLAITLGNWIAVMTWAMLRARRRADAEEVGETPAAG